MPRCTLVTCLALLLGGSALAGPLEDAIALLNEKKVAEARTALESLTAAEPGNAQACYYLGLTLLRTGDPKLLESAVGWFKKAAEIEPENTDYLFIYGGNSLNLAGKTRSLGAANRGREALEKVVKLDPAHLNAHEALFQFYEQAPWPIGSGSKANAHLEEIRKRDADRALRILVSTKLASKDYADAFKLCEDVLARNPDNYFALLLYGQTAITSGQNLDTALARFTRCLTLAPPKNAGGPAFVHWRIGNVQEKRGDMAAARAAYEASLQVDPNFARATEALAKLK